MSFVTYGWGSVPGDYRGVPISEQDRQHMNAVTRGIGSATEELYALKEQPEVWLRVAAFLRGALGRSVELRESAGFLDPYVRVGDVEYSLLRDEGHGLRELVVLLAATYRKDWPLLVVDEPELHLHPSMARIWLAELNRECSASGRCAIVVTHQPSLVKPQSAEDLKAIWLFAAGSRPLRVSDQVLPVQEERVTASLSENPQLVSQLVFSPRPVLVEGIHDAAAMTTALGRTQPAEVVAQTDLVDCGGSGSVGLWLEICQKLNLDVKAVADLDACFTNEVQRVMDSMPQVQGAYRNEFMVEPPRTHKVLEPLIQEANRQKIATDEKSRAAWLSGATFDGSGFAARRNKLLSIWQDAGLWLHPQGTLEQVLSIPSKGVAQAKVAASVPSPIDDVVQWCAYRLDPSGDLELMLNVAAERAAHAIMEAERTSPGVVFRAPVGGNAVADARLLRVDPVQDGRYRLTVIAPQQFIGYWLEFSRDTPSSDLQLQPPEAKA
jgi:hypothetical protein